MKRHRIAALLLIIPLLLLAFGAGGCNQLRTWTRAAIGAPSAEQIERSDATIAAAEEAIEAAQAQAAKLDAERAAADRQAEQNAKRADELRAVMRELSQRMAEATGDAFEALRQTYDQYSARLGAVQNQRDEYEALAAELGADLQSLDIDLQRQTIKLDNARARRAALDDETAAAMANAGRAATEAGQAAQALGLPGGGAAGETAGNLIQWGLSVILGGGALGGTYMARKRGKERDDAARQRDDLVEVVQVNERHDMIVHDEQRKANARASLAPAARQTLAMAKAGAL